MASYRPKSLNELNSTYDKSIASQNVIKDTASAIDLSAFDNTETVKAQTESFFKEESISAGPVCADLSEDISVFIKNFGKPASPEDEAPAPRRVPVKPRPTTQPKLVKPAAVPVATPVASAAAVKEPEEAPAPAQSEPKKQEKPELVITQERSELFDEYMRVMSDDEDDDGEFEAVSRHRKKRRGKKAAEPVYEKDDFDLEEALPEEKPEVVKEEPEESFSAPAEEPVKADSSFEPDEYTYDDDAEPEQDEAEYYPEEDEAEEEPDEQNEPKKGGFLKVALLMLLLLTLVSALAVTAVQAVLKVDSGLTFNNSYYFYTVSRTDTIVGINEGDLLVAQAERVSNGDVFAFYKPADKSFDFAVKTFAEGSEITTGDNSEGPVRLRNTDIYGRVTRIYPSVGAIASFIKDNFILVISLHIVIAAIALILFVFTSKAKKNRDDDDNFTFDEDEDDEETLEEHFSLKSRR